MKKIIQTLKFLFIFVIFISAKNVYSADIFTGENCSLIEAINSAETNTSISGCVSGEGGLDNIFLTQDESLNSRYLGSENSLPLITSEIYIHGNNHTINNVQTGSNFPFRVFAVDGGSLYLKDLVFNNTPNGSEHPFEGGFIRASNDSVIKIKNTDVFDFSASSKGGAIYSFNSPLYIEDSSFMYSSADVGGSIYAQDSGEVVVKNTEFKHNSASSQGGAIATHGQVSLDIDSSLFFQNSSDFYGAISAGSFSFGKSLTIKDSEFERNYSNMGASVGWNGWQGNVLINRSTFYDNKGFSDGAAFVNEDGEAKISIINSTFSLNESFGSGSGVLNRGENAKIYLIFSTFVENYSNSSDGTVKSISPLAWATGSKIQNNIFYTNVGGDCSFGSLSNLDISNNLSDDGTCGDVSATGVDTVLAMNGGSTRTHKLFLNSNAIDAASFFDCPKSDQRLQKRMIDGDGDGAGACDIGSYEYRQKTKPNLLKKSILSR